MNNQLVFPLMDCLLVCRGVRGACARGRKPARHRERTCICKSRFWARTQEGKGTIYRNQSLCLLSCGTGHTRCRGATAHPCQGEGLLAGWGQRCFAQGLNPGQRKLQVAVTGSHQTALSLPATNTERCRNKREGV